MHFPVRTALILIFLCLAATISPAAQPPAEAIPAAMLHTAPPLPAPAGEVVRVADEKALQAAVAGLKSGQTILLAPGEYNLSRTLILAGHDSVALRGATGQRGDVILRGEGFPAAEQKIGSLIQAYDCRGLVIADLTLTGAWWHLIHVAGDRGAVGMLVHNVHFVDSKEQLFKVNPGYHPTVFADSGTVEFCRFEFTGRACQRYTAGVDILGAAGWRVHDCDFIRIRGPQPDSLCDAAVMFWQHCRDLTVERCFFYECDFGVWVGLDEGYKAGRREPGTAFDIIGAVVRDNVIFRRQSGDTGISLHHAKDFEVSHNTIVLNGTYPCCVEYRFAGTRGRLSGNLSDGPLCARDSAAAELEDNVDNAAAGWFVDPADGDLRLTPAGMSALRNSGQGAPIGARLGEPSSTGP